MKQERALKSEGRVQCYKCGKFGHYRAECTSEANQDRHVGSGKSRSMSEENALHFRHRSQESQAIVRDSGASSYMFYDRSVFSRLAQKGPHSVITVRDGRTVFADITRLPS